MLIKKKRTYNFRESLVTDEKLYLNRRNLIKGLGSLLIYPSFTPSLLSENIDYDITSREPTKFEILTRYNNFFEFGTSKEIWKASQKLNTEKWKIGIKGGKYSGKEISLDSIIKNFRLEERIYKFRCVEAWSMIVPWYGFQLSELLKFLEPETEMKYISFKTFFDPEVAFNQKQTWYPWPYQEIITLEEANNPLAFIATGLYGKKLPNQNGAPLRIFIPWNYGFISAKAIVKIKFVEKMPMSSWMWASPREYGFYSNVNPNVNHPRWSQATERIIGDGIWAPRVKTLMFNGYGDQVANLYTGMDLKKNF